MFIPNTSTYTNFLLLHMFREKSIKKLCQLRIDSLSLQASKFLSSLFEHWTILYASK